MRLYKILKGKRILASWTQQSCKRCGKFLPLGLRKHCSKCDRKINSEYGIRYAKIPKNQVLIKKRYKANVEARKERYRIILEKEKERYLKQRKKEV